MASKIIMSKLTTVVPMPKKGFNDLLNIIKCIYKLKPFNSFSFLVENSICNENTSLMSFFFAK